MFRITLITLIVATATSCVSTATLRADAEAVFREHNRVAGEIMFVLAELRPDDPNAVALTKADNAMLDACQALNDLAIAHRDQRQTGVTLGLRLPATIDACRETTAAAAVLLD